VPEHAPQTGIRPPRLVQLETRVDEELLELIANRVADKTVERLGRRTEWLTVDGAADHLAMAPDAVRALIKRSRIPYEKTPAGHIRLERSTLDAWTRGEIG